jgi:hypothetical protein
VFLTELGKLPAHLALFLFCQAPASGTHAALVSQNGAFVAGLLNRRRQDHKSVYGAGSRPASVHRRTADFGPDRSTAGFGCVNMLGLVNREAFR